MRRSLRKQFHLTDVCSPAHSIPANLVERPVHRAVGSHGGDSNRQYSCGRRTFGACLLQLAGSAGGCLRNALSERRRPQSPAARNRAILWLVLETGLQICEVCRVRLADVDRADATVTVRGKSGHIRTFPLSADGQRALDTYLDQARLTPTWEPAVPEARDRLLLTEQRHPLPKKSLTLLLKRLSQRAAFTKTPICPSMLRDTYAIRFLQAGAELTALQKQLGVADLVWVKRYQDCCKQGVRSERPKGMQKGLFRPGHPSEARADSSGSGASERSQALLVMTRAVWKNPWLSRDDRSARLFQKSDRVPALQKRTETGEARSLGEAHGAFGREQEKSNSSVRSLLK